MTTSDHRAGLQLRSLVKPNGTIEVSLVRVPTPEPAPDEVVVRVEAAPINPSDLGLLFGSADLATLTVSGTAARPVTTAIIPENRMASMAGRVGQSLPAGIEGAGLVVGAGSSPEAQALVGKLVAALGGAMYSQFRCVKVDQCVPLPAGTTAVEGASSFVNPLTALGMIETMRHEGHSALVHTAAASNLGQMLHRVCMNDKVPLVNIVRKQEQVDTLRRLGALYVCNSTSSSFPDDLTDALVATGATLAFDAVGGGKLAGQIVTCMERAINKTANGYSRYGSATHKQVYVYGILDGSPTEFKLNFGMAWGIGGWLVSNFLQKVGDAAARKLKARVASELKTTFASRYSGQGSLAEALQVDTISSYARRATGEKYLVLPNKDVLASSG